MTELNLFSLSKKWSRVTLVTADLLQGEEEGLEMYFISKRNKIMASDRKHKSKFKSDKSKFKVSDF